MKLERPLCRGVADRSRGLCCAAAALHRVVGDDVAWIRVDPAEEGHLYIEPGFFAKRCCLQSPPSGRSNSDDCGASTLASRGPTDCSEELRRLPRRGGFLYYARVR